MSFNIHDRRRFLTLFASGATAFLVPGAFAEALTRTPAQTEGPFYPDHLPLDTDNDLLILNNSLTPAVGEVTHLSGRILSASGEPIRNAAIEIWQVDNLGVYIHSKDSGYKKHDTNFQGFGRFTTGSTGEYYFRTIKPVAYAAGAAMRTPHIHFTVKAKGQEKLTTQCYINGEKLNEVDMVLKGVTDPRQRESVIIDFKPIPGSKAGELAAKFDIVLGFTPEA